MWSTPNNALRKSPKSWRFITDKTMWISKSNIGVITWIRKLSEWRLKRSGSTQDRPIAPTSQLNAQVRRSTRWAEKSMHLARHLPSIVKSTIQYRQLSRVLALSRQRDWGWAPKALRKCGESSKKHNRRESIWRNCSCSLRWLSSEIGMRMRFNWRRNTRN